MKSEGLILASVLGACSLFGFGVSQAVELVVNSGSIPAISIPSINFEQTPEKSAEQVRNELRSELSRKYKNLEISDSQLDDLSCGEEDQWGNKTCYKGPTDQTKRYGTANVILDGKISYARLISTPSGAFLSK
jgi:hypothetical protein